MLYKGGGWLAAAEQGRKVSKEAFERALPGLRTALLDAQTRLRRQARFPVLIVIAGVDGGGKGDTVNVLHEWFDPRFLVTHAFGPPSDEEAERPPYWRYWRALPPKGRIGIFFESCYTQPLGGAMKRKDLDRALERIRAHEKLLADDGTLLLKFYFHLSKKAQKKRLKTLADDPARSWRVTEDDWAHFRSHGKFRRAAERVLAATHTLDAPWIVVEGADEEYRNITVAKAILKALRARLKRPHRPPKAPTLKRLKPAKRLEGLDLSLKMTERVYHRERLRWQGRLHELSRKAQKAGVPAVFLFEGSDAAGKGGAIRRLTAALDARYYRVIPVAAPTEEERAQPYLWRFWRQLPRAGHLTIFDRSWYGRLLVERVEGYAGRAEWQRAYGEIRDFEAHLLAHGTALAKCWLHIDKDEQLRRFRERERTPWKRFKITPEDYRNRAKWGLYAHAAEELFARTGTLQAPWTLVAANDKAYARVKVLKACCAALERALS